MAYRSVLPTVLVLMVFAAGCATTRTITISTIPPDARLKVDDRDRGRGPLPETFVFSGGVEQHTVRAEREGYRPQAVTITPEYKRESLVIELKPAPRTVTFNVQPIPAVLKLNGQPLSDEMVSEIRKDIEFRLDPTGKWNTFVVRAEHEGFKPVERTLRYEDPDMVYVLELEPMRKDLFIATEPVGADVYINDEFFGKSPVERLNYAFPLAADSDGLATLKVRVEKPGYVTREEEIGWDDGKINYDYTLEPQQKIVRVITDPADATVRLGRIEFKRDASGAHTHPTPLTFITEKGDVGFHMLHVSKAKTADAEWIPEDLKIEWDNGQTEYRVKLREKLERAVPLVRVRMSQGADGAWSPVVERATPIALKDETEGSEGDKPVKVTKLKGATIDSLAVSPDGSQLVYTTITADAPGKDVRSQMFVQAIVDAASGETSGDAKAISDGRSLEIMPSYTPDGGQIVFSSNRAGRRLSIWAMPVGDNPVPEQLTNGESHDLWPSVDSRPKPRLFYESRIDTRAEARLFSTPLDVVRRKDLSPIAPASGATQPRVGPLADTIVFAAVTDEKTGKRDIFRMNDSGGDVTNLTNTPGVDEFDPAWSTDARRIAFAADRGGGGAAAGAAPSNPDIWVIDAAGGTQPVRVTSNPSWDDSPAWGPDGRTIYFRSNRGWNWNVWRIELK